VAAPSPPTKVRLLVFMVLLPVGFLRHQLLLTRCCYGEILDAAGA
jgi:hypothetical protein